MMPSLARVARAVIAAILIVLGLAAASAAAADLRIGRSNEPSSLDPQFSRTGNNLMTAQDMFDRLIENDANLQTHPALAVSWKTIDPLTWEVKLREGVRFHDGSPFTADDVVFSMERAGRIPNSPAPFSGSVRGIAGMTVVDAHTIRFRTKQPTPEFIEQIGRVYIVSKKVAEGKRSEDFTSPAVAVGTGPYKLREFVPADHLTLVRNDAYWGKKPAFDTVTIKFITNDAARVAALKSGAVDLIDSVPPADLKFVEKSAGLHLYSTPSARIIYLALDASRDPTPFVVGADGKPLSPNPLRNPKVRLALSKLINRPLIVSRVLDGAGEPAGQLVPEGVLGYAPDLKAEAYDPAGAKALLAEAGYKDGFGITLHTSNDRFFGDKDIAQAIGQMFARGGLKVRGVVAQPYNVYASAATRRDYSVFIFSFGTTTPSSSFALVNVLETYDKAAGTGAFNRMRYSNPAFDAALTKALQAFDDHERGRLLADATRIAMKDTALVPLYWPKLYWATRGKVTYVPGKDEDTRASLAGLAP
ncbi:MAG TPA: ABC transporter substrate-binding protein [Casimicrobiaceae bacterium]|nr:ABC transporter substrate-binding protein [Casimicrobiaceae bacterium]